MESLPKRFQALRSRPLPDKEKGGSRSGKGGSSKLEKRTLASLTKKTLLDGQLRKKERKGSGT